MLQNLCLKEALSMLGQMHKSLQLQQAPQFGVNLLVIKRLLLKKREDNYLAHLMFQFQVLLMN